MKYFVSLDGTEFAVDLQSNADGTLAATVHANGESETFDAVRAEALAGASAVTVGNQLLQVNFHADTRGPRQATVTGLRSEIYVQSERDRRLTVGKTQARVATGWVRSPMPGRILQVLVAEGEHVAKGSALIIVEAMKMQNELVAEFPGVVTSVRVRPGDAVERDAELVRIEP